jgi:O-acetyl-ADP-ribose deacetylase (regulator of RNase III)
LTTLNENNLQSISFPSIGTRGFGHPNNLITSLSLKSTIQFLEKNPNKEFNVSFVIYEKDDDIIQVNICFCFYYSILIKKPYLKGF